VENSRGEVKLFMPDEDDKFQEELQDLLKDGYGSYVFNLPKELTNGNIMGYKLHSAKSKCVENMKACNFIKVTSKNKNLLVDIVINKIGIKTDSYSCRRKGLNFCRKY